uniref:Threonylcarbamoyl-AMP synthase n=3 Tax=Eukaryota TaxID=2759 RepID=A0A7S3XW62_HETAK|mmetsp:Transcript_4958/g.17982  ORF Transcript_4958/g.17982 Transcript_4958/m.17982 type:complete len:810 (+) Transcript_4958:937-3366(+)
MSAVPTTTALTDRPHGAPMCGARLKVRGIVQGVGFRPQALRLARALGVVGSVHNEGTMAIVEAFGPEPALAEFEQRLRTLDHGGTRIDALLAQPLAVPAALPSTFSIADSALAQPGLGVAPDWAICPACCAETLDPFARRYRYAFTACTACGPRLSVFERAPYDRAHTTMAPFPLCAACAREYADTDDRRFHAQAMACHACGPRATLRRLDGKPFSLEALTALDDADGATSLLGRGELVLVKGLGGYQIACDATRADAVARLRALKRREGKPFALLVRDIEMARQWCLSDDVAEAALASPAAPIVLLPRRADAPLADGVAPGLPTLGVMLPNTALHLLLMRRRKAPIVLTSGNLSEEPQAIRLDDAAARLGPSIAWVLDHDRAIQRRVDDSVGRVVGGALRVMRRARGYAPAPLPLPKGFDHRTKVLALGGDLKNTFALVRDGQGVLSQHIGDLHDAACLADQRRALADYLAFYAFEPDLVACDLHPGYAATQHAQERWPDRQVGVGHHHAHIAACLGEHGWPLHGGKVLGIALDGIGMGEDGSFWGGEFLLADYRQAQRVGTFKPVCLPGGDLAAREPWRNTYAQLMAEMGWPRFTSNYDELELHHFLSAKPREMLDAMLANPALAPRASSVGRLFDAVAAAIGVCREQVAYEGEAAMRLESLVTAQDLDESAELDYPFAIPRLDKGKGLPYVEPLGMWQAVLGDLILATPAARIAARFHRGLAAVIVRMAQQEAERHELTTVALGGGVFQNKVLSELVLRGLEAAGLKALLPCQVPVNDGGLAWGQALIALARASQNEQRQETSPCV